MTNKIGSLAFVLLLTAIPVFVFYDIGTRFADEGVHTGSAENNAAMYPRLVAILMAGLLAIQAVRVLLERTKDDPRPDISALIKTHARSVIVFILFLIYIWAFRWFGFVYSTPVFLLITQWVLGIRQPVVLIGYSIGVTAAVYYAFSKILNLALPAGDFFG